jgi:hypothetical protein
MPRQAAELQCEIEGENEVVEAAFNATATY